MNIPINPSLAIGVIIKNKNNKILLAQEGRDKYYEKAKDIWGLPAGKVEWTESIENGLKREMKEELNIEIKPIGLVGVYQYLRNDSQCLGLAFVVELMGEEENIKHNQKELRALQWFDIKEIRQSNLQLRDGVKEVIEDYKKNYILPFEFIHFFDFQK